MLNSNIQVNVIPLPIYKGFRIISKNVEGNTTYPFTILTNINQDEEEKLNNIKDEDISIIRNDKKFVLNNRNILFYGDIDLNKQEDCDAIKNLNFLNHLGAVGVRLYSNYDYNTHSCTSTTRRLKYYESWNVLDVFKYHHATLGKPSKILIFKCKKI